MRSVEMLQYPHFHRALCRATYETVAHGEGESGGALTYAVGVMNAAGLAAIAQSTRGDGRMDVKEFVIAFCANAMRLSEVFHMVHDYEIGFHRIVRALETPGEDFPLDVLDNLQEHVARILGGLALDLARRRPQSCADSRMTVADRATWVCSFIESRVKQSPPIQNKRAV